MGVRGKGNSEVEIAIVAELSSKTESQAPKKKTVKWGRREFGQPSNLLYLLGDVIYGGTG